MTTSAKRCSMPTCGGRMVERVIPPAARGALTVVAHLCPKCDRGKCEKCENYCQDAYAKKCPSCGHSFIEPRDRA